MPPVGEVVGRFTVGWTATEWLTAATWLCIAAFVAAEMAVLERRDPDGTHMRRKALRTAVTMATGALAVGVLYGALFSYLWSITGHLAPSGARGLWERHPVLAALCAFVAWDFSGWIYHLIGHRSRLGWAAHSPHHSGPRYDASLALRLTWMPWHGLTHHPLLALAGFRFELILGCLAVSNTLQALQHSSTLPEAPRWLAAVVMTPAAHRHHHGPEGAHRNLGPVLTIWDRMAGTWYPPTEVPATPHGHDTTSARPARGAVGTELAGWLEVLRGVRHRAPTRAPHVGPGTRPGRL